MTDKGDTRNITINDFHCPSWNTLYASRHWTVRDNLVQEIRKSVRSAIDPEDEPFTGRVSIEIAYYFKGRAIDPDNVPAKLLVDAIKEWTILDDTPDYIESVTTRCERAPHCPRLEILVRQVGERFLYSCSCCDRLWPTRKLKAAHEKQMGLNKRDY